MNRLRFSKVQFSLSLSLVLFLFPLSAENVTRRSDFVNFTGVCTRVNDGTGKEYRQAARCGENLRATVINCGSFERNKSNHRHFYYYANHKTRYYRAGWKIEEITAARQKARSINSRFYRTEIDTGRILFPRSIYLSIFPFLPDKTDRA